MWVVVVAFFVFFVLLLLFTFAVDAALFATATVLAARVVLDRIVMVA